MTSAAENSSAVDFVPGLSTVDRAAMRKVEDTARGLLAANTELQRQVAAGKGSVSFWQREAGSVYDQLEEMTKQRDFALVNLDRVISERDAAREEVTLVTAERESVTDAAKSRLDNLRGEIEAREAGNRKWRRTAERLTASLDESQLALADQHERAAAVVAAWTEEGPVAGIHRRWKQRVRGGWPALGRALDRLATEVR